MKNFIKEPILRWLDNSPRGRQWVWFIALWIGGVVAVTLLTWPFKLLVRLASTP